MKSAGIRIYWRNVQEQIFFTTFRECFNISLSVLFFFLFCGVFCDARNWLRAEQKKNAYDIEIYIGFLSECVTLSIRLQHVPFFRSVGIDRSIHHQLSRHSTKSFELLAENMFQSSKFSLSWPPILFDWVVESRAFIVFRAKSLTQTKAKHHFRRH